MDLMKGILFGGGRGGFVETGLEANPGGHSSWKAFHHEVAGAKEEKAC